MNTKAIFSSKTSVWETPQALFEEEKEGSR